MDTDEVHDLIETERMHFVLSGLSGRKLKRSGEALVRNFVDLARFLHVTSVCNGQQLKFANVSCDTGVPATSFTGCRNRTHTTAGWMTETHFAIKSPISSASAVSPGGNPIPSLCDGSAT